jgi:TatD DNase family protein
MWTDAHCHVREGAEDVIDEAREAGVGRFVTVGTDLASSRLAIDVASRHDGVWATAGLHPHDAKDGLGGIEALLDEPGIVGVGECGLDYFYDHSPRDVQRDVFTAQIALAKARDLTLVIHTRDAWEDTFAILDAEGAPDRLVFHCFTGGPDEARRGLDLGAVLSFSGIVSFTTADDVRAAAGLCPLDRMTVETDSPYLAPVPHRGKSNRPAWVPYVGAAVAAAKGVELEVIEEATTATAERLFHLVHS